MTGISVTSPEDRPTREQQLERLTGLIPSDGRAKLRVVVQMLEDDTKQYTPLRDASWLIEIPKAALDQQPGTIEQVLDQLNLDIRAIAARAIPTNG